jgi:hypothetical protein
MRRWRARRVLLAGLFLAAAGTAGTVVYLRRVELFILPRLWREVVEMHARSEPWEPLDWRALPNIELDEALRRLWTLQRPRGREEAEDASAFGLKRLWAEGGREAWVFLKREGSSGPLELVLLDARGRLVGEPLVVSLPDAGISVVSGQDEQDLLALESSESELFLALYSVDGRGLVPRGWGIREDGATLEFAGFSTRWIRRPERAASWIFVPAALSPKTRHWLELDRRPPLAAAALGRLLASPARGDLFRALHEIERQGPRLVHLALPLLEHDDPQLRARAAAVAGNDPSRSAAILPLLEDAAVEVRLAAGCALLNAPDPEAARRALALLLAERCLAVYYPALCFEVARALSPEAARQVLAWARDPSSAHPLALEARFTRAFRAEHLRPLVPDILAARGEIEESLAAAPDDVQDNGELRAELAVLAEWLVRAEDERADAALLGDLRRWIGGEERVAAGAILGALLERRAPLRAPGATEALEQLAAGGVETPHLDGDLIREASLLLAWWEAPGALERIAAGLRDPGRRWLGREVPDSFDQPRHSRPEWPPYSVFDGAGGPFATDIWVRHSPPSLLPVLLELLDPEEHCSLLSAILQAQPPAALRPLAPRLAELWRHSGEVEAYAFARTGLAFALARVEDPALDRLVARELEELAAALEAFADRSGEPLLAPHALLERALLAPAFLWALLERRTPLAAPEAVRALQRLTARKLRGADLELSGRIVEGADIEAIQIGELESARDRPRRDWRRRVSADRRWYRSTTGLFFDRQLAAALLLVHWEAPDAAEALIARLCQPRNEWLLDFLWEEHTPAALIPALERLASEEPERYRERVEWLAARSAAYRK